MTPWIDLEETRSRTDDDQFRVRFVVQATSGIPAAIFVHKAQGQAFDHVATVDELDAVPDEWDEARRTYAALYRAATCERVLRLPSQIQAFVEHVQDRVLSLTRAWSGPSAYAHPETRRYVLGGETDA